MIFSFRFLNTCAVAFAAAWITGCVAPDAYYLLSSEGPAPAASGAASSGVVGLGPVSIPDYINRPELVFQRGPNRFEVPANHRWMGSLEENVVSVLTANLARRVGGGGVRSYPWSGGRPPVAVAVDIERFHAVSGGDAVLEAAWHVTTGSATRTRRATFQEPLLEEGYDGVIAAQSRLLARLAEAIAASL